MSPALAPSDAQSRVLICLALQGPIFQLMRDHKNLNCVLCPRGILHWGAMQCRLRQSEHFGHFSETLRLQLMDPDGRRVRCNLAWKSWMVCATLWLIEGFQLWQRLAYSCRSEKFDRRVTDWVQIVSRFEASSRLCNYTESVTFFFGIGFKWKLTWQDVRFKWIHWNIRKILQCYAVLWVPPNPRLAVLRLKSWAQRWFETCNHWICEFKR